MDLIFNELSLKKIPAEKEVGDTVMHTFVEKLKLIQKTVQRKMVLKATLLLKGAHIADNYAMMQWAKNPKNRENAAFLLALVAKEPILRDYPPYYFYDNEECAGLGIAHENNDFAVSFPYPQWDEDQYNLLKTDENERGITEESASVKHFGQVTLTRINTHFQEKGEMLFYDCESKFSPRDNQTILFDTQKFTFTGKHYPFGEGKKIIRRKIYHRKSDGTYWYVDNLHYGCAAADGKAAHLEVFDANKNHIGIADIQTGVIDRSRKEEGRTIKNNV